MWKWAVMLCCVAMMEAQADPLMESVQQKLKDQGFYYGEVTGTRDAETMAAIRRYQIRNGLQITGQLNPETQKSLGFRGGAPAPKSTPPTVVAPTPPPRQMPAPDTSDLRDDEPATEENGDDGTESMFQDSVPATGAALFAGTPFEEAPSYVQEQVIVGAQSILARRGYYRSGVDGVFGSGTEFALRAYQARFGIVQTGRLDTETLASMGLLPGQRAPGLTAPRRRSYRQPPAVYIGPNGERVYVPR